MSEALHEQVFHDAASDGELDVHGIGRAIARRKWQVIVPTLVAFVAAAVYVNVVTPRYTGEAQVLVENQENYFTRPDNARNRGRSGARRRSGDEPDPARHLARSRARCDQGAGAQRIAGIRSRCRWHRSRSRAS